MAAMEGFKLNSDKHISRLLGVMFLIVAIASLVSGFLLLSIIDTDNISETMISISDNPTTLQITILGELITSIAIVLLGVLLFTVLKKQNHTIALWAFGLYIIEAIILAFSRIFTFNLLFVSEEFVNAGAPEPSYLHTLGNIYFDSAQFGYDMHLFVFSIGAILFYYLFLKSKSIPLVLSIWGIIAAFLVLITTLLIIFDIHLGIIALLPNMLFELAIGAWIIIKGLRPYDKKS